MKASTLQGQFVLRCLDQRIQEPFKIDKKKILVGSHEHCEYQIKDHSISSYHAFIFLKNDEGIMVKDLYSEAGVYVNGRRVEECFVGAGDVLTIGNLSFSVECLEEKAQIVNLDEAIIPAMPAEAQHFELPPKEGLIFIDGEYCDIHFDESSFKPLDTRPEVQFTGEYVQLEESVEPLEIAYTTKSKRLEVISYVNGMMMDISYLDLKDGDFFLDSVKGKKTVLFHTLERSKIFTISNGDLRFYPNEAVIPSTPWESIDLNETVFLTHGTEQVSIRLVDKGVNWRGIPLFYRDREFFQQSGKVFASIFLPLLILLFITVPKDEDIKEDKAIVYTIAKPIQKPTEAQEKSDLSAKELTSKTENTGHKDTQQPNQKVEFASASSNKKVVAKAAAPDPAAAQPVATTPVKSYSFKSSIALNSVVGDAPKINAQGTSKSALKDSTFNTGSSDTGELVAGADIGVSKFNGSDKSGSGSASYGSRGLASKSGFDSAYLEPKTVVLGSMDPELLRRILREYIPQFRHCYQQELIGTSDKIKGVIDLNFTISASGKVGKYDIRAKDARFSKKGVGCMGQVLSIIDFPKPKGGGVVDVRQPLNFFSETEKI